MALGITNAKIISGGSGGGDTVYAVSETALNVDDKVYLNKHYYDSYDADSGKISAINNKTVRSYPYVCNNGDVYRLDGIILRKFMYNSENKTWTELQNTTTIAGSQYAYAIADKRDGLIVINPHNPRYMSAIFVKYPTNGIANYIARKDLAISGTKSSSVSLREIVNPETGELGQTYSTFIPLSGGGYINQYVCIGNTLLITDGGNHYFFYDISDLTAPILLKSGTTSINTSVNAYTGLSVGDYLFTRTNVAYGETGNNNLVKNYCTVYKIMEDYSLVLASDLPSEFYTYLANPRSTYIFNRENNTLAIGDENGVNLYKFIDGTFKKLSYNVPIPSSTITPVDSAGWCLFVSEDLSTAVVSAQKSGSGVYNDFHIYKMVNNNDNWYAEDYIHSNALSLQGFATGNTNDEGLYEISTVLPKKINLTINTNVDTVVEMRGDVE